MIKCPYCTTKFLTEHGLKTHISTYHVFHKDNDNERMSIGIPTILPDINFNFSSQSSDVSSDSGFDAGGGDFGGGGASGDFGGSSD